MKLEIDQRCTKPRWMEETRPEFRRFESEKKPWLEREQQRPVHVRFEVQGCSRIEVGSEKYGNQGLGEYSVRQVVEDQQLRLHWNSHTRLTASAPRIDRCSSDQSWFGCWAWVEEHIGVEA